mmetsp:Transcript_5338/g.15052  ORF Transcript_5338/g.15052 Transcript_5338/m.15052 type:complete len:285 (+) Transcript_5338:3387-4241(+)
MLTGPNLSRIPKTTSPTGVRHTIVIVLPLYHGTPQPRQDFGRQLNRQVIGRNLLSQTFHLARSMNVAAIPGRAVKDGFAVVQVLGGQDRRVILPKRVVLMVAISIQQHGIELRLVVRLARGWHPPPFAHFLTNRGRIAHGKDSRANARPTFHVFAKDHVGFLAGPPCKVGLFLPPLFVNVELIGCGIPRVVVQTKHLSVRELVVGDNGVRVQMDDPVRVRNVVVVVVLEQLNNFVALPVRGVSPIGILRCSFGRVPQAHHATFGVFLVVDSALLRHLLLFTLIL